MRLGISGHLFPYQRLGVNMQDAPILPPKVDLEMATFRNRNGFPAVAAWIARDPDNETFIFRKFDELTARNLLHLQSQVIVLEAKLKKYDEESRDNEELNKSLLAWETFERRANDGNYPEETDRMELVKEIQVKLKDYRQSSQINGYLPRHCL
jgi:hypothetical protein